MNMCLVFKGLYRVIPLPRWRSFLLRVHFDKCPACQTRLASREECRGLLVDEESLRERGKPPVARQDPRAEVPRFRPKARFWKWRWTAAVSAFLLALVAFLLVRERPVEEFTPRGEGKAQFRINYTRIGDDPASAYLFHPRESRMIIVWVEREPTEEKEEL